MDSIASLALRRVRIWVAAAVVPLCACAAVLGIDDGHPRGTGLGDDGSVGVGDATLTDTGVIFGDDSAVGDDDSSVGPPTGPDGSVISSGCEPGVTLAAPNGVFVAMANGDDGAACTQAAPCKTIGHGIEIAHNLASAATVYVQDGLYGEQVVMQAGVDVIGGWNASWVRHCVQTSTIVRAPANQSSTVLASFNGSAKLSTMLIESKGPTSVAPGESIYGIRATGGSTNLTLAYVEVSVASGGDGTPGVTGDAGAVPSGACTTPGDGGSAKLPGGKGNGADAGWFDGLGYEVASASSGEQGASGFNGALGSAGTCVHCLSNCMGTGLCSYTDAGLNCGEPGEPGCGGPGGSGGVAGGSGGSSVALFVADAVVTLSGCAFESGGGGNGGAGGMGGGGASGSTGATGAPSAECNTTCSLNIQCTGGTPKAGQGGPAGAQGGTGAIGGAGGDGAGGDSFGIVETGGAAVRMSDAGSVISVGPPGFTVDGGNGAAGTAGAHLP